MRKIENMRSRMSLRGNEPTEVSPKYVDLLNRNEALTLEILRMRVEYRNLQKQYNEVMMKTIQVVPQVKDASIQTENQLETEEISNSKEGRFQPEDISRSLNFNLFNQKRRKSTLVRDKCSPVEQRVSNALAGKIENEKERKGNQSEEPDEDFPIDASTNEGKDQIVTRTPRARKEVIYTEPSLRVKVRKGFKFFKTKEDTKK